MQVTLRRSGVNNALAALTSFNFVSTHFAWNALKPTTVYAVLARCYNSKYIWWKIDSNQEIYLFGLCTDWIENTNNHNYDGLHLQIPIVSSSSPAYPKRGN